MKLPVEAPSYGPKIRRYYSCTMEKMELPLKCGSRSTFMLKDPDQDKFIIYLTDAFDIELPVHLSVFINLNGKSEYRDTKEGSVKSIARRRGDISIEPEGFR